MKHLLRYIPLLFISFLTYCTTTEEGLDKAEVMKLSTDSIEAEALGGENTFYITSRCAWEAKTSYESEDTGWIELSDDADEGSTEITVTLSENTSAKDRYATIEVSNARYNLASSIRVHQKAGEPFINLDNSNKEVDTDGGKVDIIVTSNIDYTIATSDSWVQASADSGVKGEQKIIITVNENTAEEPRTATVTFSNKEYNISAVYTITQQKFVPVVVVNDKNIACSANGSTKIVAIDGNISWSASCDADWVNITPTKGEKGSSTLKVVVAENTKTTAREAVIKICNSEYKVEKQITISQEAWSPVLNLSTKSISAPAEGATESITIEGDISWEASCTADWVTITPTMGDKGTSTIEVVVAENTKTTAREAVIKICNSEYKVEKQITISQAAFNPILNVSTEDIYASYEGATESITIEVDISWEASCTADWVTITPTMGDKGTSTIEVVVAENTKTTAREAVIKICNSEYEVEKQITISQEAWSPVLNLSTESISTLYTGATESITIEGNISWEASCAADWVTITPTMGDKGASTIEVVVAENFKTVARETTVKVFNAEYNLEKQITISQEAVPNNVILYTSSDEKVVEPNETNAFGASIVSNTYKNGQGIMLFNAPVTSIGDSAFEGCNELTSVTIPDSVTEIGGYAFYSCSSLTSVTIPDSVTSIGNCAFWSCSSLTSVTIPDSVTSIGVWAFSGCTSLTSVTIPDSITTIGVSAFHSCSSLTSVTIPDSVTSIGYSAFYSCTSLTSVTIPDSVTEIGESAFIYCSSLTSVTIGNGVTEIGYGAFFGCDSLTSVYCKPTTPPSLGENAFKRRYYGNMVNIGCTIYVPTASVEAYKSAEYWSDYASDIVGYEF